MHSAEASGTRCNKYGVVAQLVEQLFCKQTVAGSNPAFSTISRCIRSLYMKRKLRAPRNPFVAAARFKKAGAHKKPYKAVRRQEKIAVHRGCSSAD